MTLEHRSLADPVELRSDPETGRVTVSGVAMRYGAASKPMQFRGRGVAREQFTPGAFAKTLQETDVRSHLEHLGPYLGRTDNASLRITDSPGELRYALDLPNTTAGRDAGELLGRGDIKGSSIGFRAIPSQVEWSVGADGLALRTVREAHLGLIDLTVSPAYDDSTAEMVLRSFAVEVDAPIDQVLAAAAAGDLRSLIDAHTGDDDPDDDETEGRTTSTFRPPMTSLLV